METNNLNTRNSIEKDTSEPSNRDDPTYIEPFVLPKFEKQNQQIQAADSLQIFPMNASQVSFNDILSQIRSKTTMSQAHQN